MNLRKVKVDPFATCKIARDHNLTAPQSWVLHLLAIQAAYRSGEWAGTLSVLADDSRLSPRTVAAAVRVLIEKGLVEDAPPFDRETRSAGSLSQSGTASFWSDDLSRSRSRSLSPIPIRFRRVLNLILTRKCKTAKTTRAKRGVARYYGREGWREVQRDLCASTAYSRCKAMSSPPTTKPRRWPSE